MNVYMRHPALAGVLTFRVLYPAIPTLGITKELFGDLIGGPYI